MTYYFYMCQRHAVLQNRYFLAVLALGFECVDGAAIGINPGGAAIIGPANLPEEGLALCQ